MTRPPRSPLARALLLVVAVVALGAGAWLWHTQRQAQVLLAAAAEQHRQLEAAWDRLQSAETARLATELSAGLTVARQQRDAVAAALAPARAQLAAAAAFWKTFEADTEAHSRHVAELSERLKSAPGARARLAAEEDAATELLYRLAEIRADHPARAVEQRLAQAIATRDLPAMQAATTELAAFLADLPQEIAAERERLLCITGNVQIDASPGSFAWQLTDAFGREQHGATPAEVHDVGLGEARILFTRDGWPPEERTVTVARGDTVAVKLDLPVATLVLDSDPPGASWTLTDSRAVTRTGTTPARLDDLAPGRALIDFARPNWSPRTEVVELVRDRVTRVAPTFATGSLTLTSTPAGAKVILGNRVLGRTPLQLSDVPAGPIALTLSAAGFQSLKLRGEIRASTENTLSGTLQPSVTIENFPLVTFYRPKLLKGAGVSLELSLNGRLVATLANGAFAHLRLRPGRYTVKAAQKGFGSTGMVPKSTDLVVNLLDHAWIECAVVGPGLVNFDARLDSVPAATGETALHDLSGNPDVITADVAPR